jgi:hypothetical protein
MDSQVNILGKIDFSWPKKKNKKFEYEAPFSILPRPSFSSDRQGLLEFFLSPCSLSPPKSA